VTINGVTMFFTNFAFSQPPVPPTPPVPGSSLGDVSQIMQQPVANANQNTWVTLDPGISQNIDDILAQLNQEYNDRLSQIKINPYCYASNS